MWSFIVTIFNTIIFEPLLNLLAAVLHVVPGNSMGLAIILVIVVVRLALYIPSDKSLKTQQKLSELRPHLQELSKKHKDNPQERAKAQMELYKEHGVNPLGSLFFPLFVQLPIFFGLYRVFLTEFNGNGFGPYLYSFIPNPSSVEMVFLGVDLTTPSVVFALAAGVAQFIQARSLVRQTPKSTTPKTKGEPNFQASMNMSMMYVLPVMVAGFGLTLPAGLSLYWVVSSLFSFGQQYVIQRRNKKAEAAKNPEKN